MYRWLEKKHGIKPLLSGSLDFYLDVDDPELELQLDTLRTLGYLSNRVSNGGDLLLKEMQKWMAAKMPSVKTEFRVKKGGYGTDDPDLWKEIKSANGMMVMAIGH